MNELVDGPVTVHVGDALSVLRQLPSESVHCTISSPPYWSLRDYGATGQLGLEASPEEYVAKLVEVFREVRRVLRRDGTCWLNLGDSYATSNPVGRRDASEGTSGKFGEVALAGSFDLNVRRQAGLKSKDLVGIPWRVAFALQADGWWLRSDIVWSKPNPMPESVTDRPTKAHEMVFLLTKAATYYYDSDSVREAADPDSYRPSKRAIQPWSDHGQGIAGQYHQALCRGQSEGANPNGRNLRSVWTIATQPYPEAHFATFPEDLVIPCIKAGTSEHGVCPECGSPWERLTKTEYVKSPVHGAGSVVGRHYATGQNNFDGAGMPRLNKEVETLGWQRTCAHNREPVPATVLDPFAGSGTTLAVARRLGRRAVGIELQPDYLPLIQKRIGAGALPLLELLQVEEVTR